MNDEITWDEIAEDLTDDFAFDHSQQEYGVVMNGLINAYFEDLI